VAHDFTAGGGQRARDVPRVGVERVTEDQLGADGENFELHPLLFSSAR
jgi:hypothetical protein